MPIIRQPLARLLVVAALALPGACTPVPSQTIVTIADARSAPATVVDVGEPGDSLGDMVVFDQPLLDEQGKQIGNNAGTCVRTRVAHSYQCQWTLTLEHGTIQVAGREFDKGSSMISIVGGTGRYARVRGEMRSVNNDDGTFTQTLYIAP